MNIPPYFLYVTELILATLMIVAILLFDNKQRIFILMSSLITGIGVGFLFLENPDPKTSVCIMGITSLMIAFAWCLVQFQKKRLPDR